MLVIIFYAPHDPHNTIPTGTICDLIRMILTMNNFTFNDSHYLQIHGTAMGTKMAPSFANLFLGLFEKNALRNAPFQPHTWLRYIDDIFMIWTESPENLKIFIDYLNKGRRGGLMVSALDSGSSGPGSGPGRGHCVVFLGKTLYSHGASLHPGV